MRKTSLIIGYLILTISWCRKPQSDNALRFTKPEQMMSFWADVEAYLQSTAEIIQKSRNLAIKAANGIYPTEDRQEIDIEFKELLREVCRIHQEANYKGSLLLNSQDAAWPKHAILKTGHQSAAVEFLLPEFKAESFGLSSWQTNQASAAVNLMTPKSSEQALRKMDEALSAISMERARIGAVYNRLEYWAKLDYSLSENAKLSAKDKK